MNEEAARTDCNGSRPADCAISKSANKLTGTLRNARSTLPSLPMG
jgi:hypothetical protein